MGKEYYDHELSQQFLIEATYFGLSVMILGYTSTVLE